MSEHVIEWLDAYHDGELPAGRLQQVENHLQTCPTCQMELETLMALSTLLKADPLPGRISPQHFAAQVQLLLPRKTPPATVSSQLPRWMLVIPIILIVVWAFLQAALWVTSLASLVPDFTLWFAPSDILDIPLLSLLNLLLLATTTVLWSAWMAFWYSWKHNQDSTFTQFAKEV